MRDMRDVNTATDSILCFTLVWTLKLLAPFHAIYFVDVLSMVRFVPEL